ncbi:hypothetical protein E3P91_01829 [Wallemia ichthyophaga]|nr:hypothetical protein E3P91_01829 [Wallemia ichthyophaga]
MDEAAVVTTEFVNSLDNLQEEFKFILNEIRLRDESSTEIRDGIYGKETELNTAMKGSKDVQDDTFINIEYDKLEKLSIEKLDWSNKLKILIDKHVNRVNVDLNTVHNLSTANGNVNPMSPATITFNQAPQTPTPASSNKPGQSINTATATTATATTTSTNTPSHKRPSLSEKSTTPAPDLPPKKRKLSALNPGINGGNSNGISNTSSNVNNTRKHRQSSNKQSESDLDDSSNDQDQDQDNDNDNDNAIDNDSLTDSNKGGGIGEADEDDAAYCYCQKKSYGNMIGCENDDCPISWFHFGCVNIKPPEPDVWYCTECKNKLGIPTQTPSKKLLQSIKKRK